MTKNKLSSSAQKDLLDLLQKRFIRHEHRHKAITWKAVQAKLEGRPDKLWSLYEMERTGGEPDVIGFDNTTYWFADCAAESPAGRRSYCYDHAAQVSRKEHQPKNNAIDIATAMGITLLTEDEYRYLQQFGPFDTKTSSWLLTPAAIRKEGGALFGDYRYGHVFIYHNGAQSYYAARGFRGLLKL